MGAYGTQEEFLPSHIQSFKFPTTPRGRLPKAATLKVVASDPLNTEFLTRKWRQPTEPTTLKDYVLGRTQAKNLTRDDETHLEGSPGPAPLSLLALLLSSEFQVRAQAKVS